MQHFFAIFLPSLLEVDGYRYFPDEEQICDMYSSIQYPPDITH